MTNAGKGPLEGYSNGALYPAAANESHRGGYMLSTSKIALAAALAALSGLYAVQNADAACSAIAGTWFIYGFQGSSPAITTVTLPVVTGPTISDGINIPVFVPNHPYNNNTASALACTMAIQASGRTTTSCAMYTSGLTLVGKSGAASANLRLNACNLSGTISLPGDPTPVVIRAGHLNGNMGGGIATHGTQVEAFVIVRQ